MKNASENYGLINNSSTEFVVDEYLTSNKTMRHMDKVISQYEIKHDDTAYIPRSEE